MKILKQYSAHYRYREQNDLRDTWVEIKAFSLADAKRQAKIYIGSPGRTWLKGVYDGDGVVK